MAGLRAGTHTTELPLAIGVPMMGYGARVGAAEGVHDPLHARALYLQGGSDLLIVSCELCLMGAGQAARLRQRLEAATGVAEERIAVTCIHTHSGPDTGLMEFLSGRPEPEHVARIWDAIVECGTRAVAAAAPARLGTGHASAQIGRNRRREDGPRETDVLVVRVDDAGGHPLVVLYTHGCHPTALGHENLEYSADWVGAANDAIARALPGANPIFLLGAHADIDPRTRGLLDLAIAGQSVGVGFDEVHELGEEIGRAVSQAALEIATKDDARIAAASARQPIPTHADSETQRAAALRALDLPEDADVGTNDLFRMEHERTDAYAIEEKRERLARVRTYLRGHTAHHFVGSREPEVEAQALRLGPVRLLALPAEATTAVGQAWKARVGGEAAVLSIANGWLRYLPHPQDFEEPEAHHAYEVLMSSLVPDAAERLLTAGERLHAELDGAQS